jgi:GNAT superfamily N-acetyltransferase/RimJ/RimL family protein N-acetyltransferase
MTDKAEFRQWYALFHEAELTGRPANAPAFTELEAGVLFSREDPFEKMTAYAAYAADAMVGTGLTALSLLDNTDKAFVAVTVPEPLRRQGIGSAFLDELVRIAWRAGRTAMLGQCWVPAAARDSHPFRSFAEHNGFTLANTELRRELPLPIPADTLAAWAAEAAPHQVGYQILTFVDDIPDELLASLCHAMNQLALDAPTGAIELEAEATTPETFRHRQGMLDEMGITRYWTLAIDATGETAAYTTLAVSADLPDLVDQWGTLVLRGHRGHRLGLAVKAANLAAVQAAYPERTRVNTQNAELNAPMVAINEKMGFRPVELLLEFQRIVSAEVELDSPTVAACR